MLSFLVFLTLAYAVSCTASAVMTRPERPEARVLEGFFYRHRYLAARLGWRVWPAGVPAMLVLLAADYLAFYFFAFMDDIDLLPR